MWHMDGLAIDIGRTACDVFSTATFAVGRARCADLASIRLTGYSVFGLAVFAASYLAMLRRAPV
jgi:hypothetical protein